MVFARYQDDWSKKSAWLARLTETAWTSTPLDTGGPIYNIAISGDASTIVFARQSEDQSQLWMMRATDTGWSKPENLTQGHSIAGGYVSILNDDSLLFYIAEGANGQGIYRSHPRGEAWSTPEAVLVHEEGTTFDAYMRALSWIHVRYALQ